MPRARWKRVPAAGMSPADNAVDPAGTASRSITTGSIPASLAASAAHKPGGAGADDQHRNFAVEIDVLGRLNRIHSATPVSGVCHARCWPPSTASVTPVMLRAPAR